MYIVQLIYHIHVFILNFTFRLITHFHAYEWRGKREYACEGKMSLLNKNQV